MKDYEKKNGTAPANAEAFVNMDGSVSVELTDQKGSSMDMYTVDSVSGEGTNSKGEAVNLPQTGITTKNPIAAVSGAIAAAMTGLWLTRRALKKRMRSNPAS